MSIFHFQKHILPEAAIQLPAVFHRAVLCPWFQREWPFGANLTPEKQPPKEKLGEQQSRDFHWRLQWFKDGLRKSNPGINLWLVLAATTPPGSSTTAFIGQGSTSLILPDIQTPWLNIKFLFPKYVSQYPITCYHSTIISWRLSLFWFFSLLLW